MAEKGARMIQFKEKKYVTVIPRNISCILGADIGGTNANFGIFQVQNGRPILLLSLHAKSQQIKEFPPVVKDLLTLLQQTYGITISHTLFAAAGVISPGRDYSRPTNLSIIIDAADIKKTTGLNCVYVVNDFEVIGYGLDLIAPKDLVFVNKGVAREYANKAIIGAGTGLGKCIMMWERDRKRYVPIASEGGHEDFAVQNSLELELVEFIQHKEKRSCNISWEDVLSGNGIQRIYQFFHARSNDGHDATREQIPHPDEIFNARNHDKHSQDTFTLYTKLYARCAKNFALDILARGGLYIAGGIAANNLEMFQLPQFMHEFVNCGKQAKLLKEVPVWVITDYNVSLYGAAAYLLIENMCD
jgi:glucokinase